MNSPETQNKIANGRVGRLIDAKKTDDEIARELFLWAFARAPKTDELDAVLGYVRTATARKPAFEDVLWSLLSSKEFLFNH